MIASQDPTRKKGLGHRVRLDEMLLCVVHVELLSSHTCYVSLRWFVRLARGLAREIVPHVVSSIMDADGRAAFVDKGNFRPW